MVTFAKQDIDDGRKDCEEVDCVYTHLLDAGFDYPDECWLKCERCGSWVVDEGKDKVGCDILSKD